MSPAPDIRRRLEEADVPGAAVARTRAWAAVESEFAGRRRRARRPRARAMVLAVAAVLMGGAAAAASTPPGVAVRGWVAEVLGTAAAPPAPRPSLGPLPPGRMLVTSTRGAWLVARDGSRRLLGAYSGASWSPHGLYVAAWRGAELRAVAPDGRVAWGLRAPGRIADARWSPDGFRIAYRRGGGLGIVAGDGTGAKALAARVQPAGPAWRPGRPHTLAWVDASGRIVVRDTDTGGTVWRSAASVRSARELSWSADGAMLLIRSDDGVRVASLHGRRVWRVRMGPGERSVAAAFAPRGRRLALVVAGRAGSVSRVLVGPGGGRAPGRQIFATTGRLSSPAWSPDGRRLLVRWEQADEWLLLRPDGRGRIIAIGPVARRFGGAPTVRGWCCGGGG